MLRHYAICNNALICNKLFKLELSQEFRNVCTCIYVTTNRGTEQDSIDMKDEILKFITNSADFAIYRRLSMTVIL